VRAPHKQTLLVAGQVLTLEAIDGVLTVNGVEATSRELQALGEAVHYVRVAADLQAADKRRAEKGGAA